MQLLPYDPPSNSTSFDNGNGTTGWTGGTTEDLLTKRDTVLVVDTAGLPNIQIAHGRFAVHPFTKTAYIKYKFVTQEVPGGYFGTQYNDYYTISIRTDTGASGSMTNSMNALGLGAFDADGATDWFTFSISVPPNTQSVDYDVGVSNVADALLQSQVIVDKVGDSTCDQCGDCATCPGDPVCQATCQSPPPQTCNFYQQCAEATAQCGAGGYPLLYGEKNCLRFQTNIAKFSAQGQAWIYSTMHCLQLALIPVLETCPDCGTVKTAGFQSHPTCYVSSGFCTLPCWDYVQVFATVGWDVVKSLGQVGSTGYQCLANARATLSGSCVAGNLGAAEQAAQQLAVNVAKAMLFYLIPPAY
jgi:hypothetical protein